MTFIDVYEMAKHESVERTVRAVFAEQTGSEFETADLMSSVDSLENVEILCAIEEVFDISIADGDWLRLSTVGDVIELVKGFTKEGK